MLYLGTVSDILMFVVLQCNILDAINRYFQSIQDKGRGESILSRKEWSCIKGKRACLVKCTVCFKSLGHTDVQMSLFTTAKFMNLC